MIEEIKKKLSLIFLTVLIVLNILALISVYFVLHVRLIDNAKEHITGNIDAEFMTHYRKNDFDTLEKLIEDELFEIVNINGDPVFTVKSSVHYQPPFNRALAEAASSGERVFEIVDNKDDRYLVYYTPLEEDTVLKTTMSLHELYDFEEDFRTILLIIAPAMLIVSYLLTRYMVSQSLRPIVKVMNYQETFSSNVTHELNSPLTSMKGGIEVALRKERSSKEYRETLKLSLMRINEVIKLLNNLYLLAGSKLKSLDVMKEEVNINRLFDEIIEKYEPIIYKKNIKLIQTLDAPGSLLCDESLMKRALANLMENAVKYTPSGGFLEVGTREEKKYYVIAFSNTCNNLTKDELKKIYEPFYRGSNSSVKGTGLGLHIVKYIVMSHHGKITSDLKDNIITVTIKIPYS